MASITATHPVVTVATAESTRQPRIVVGITGHETCMVLPERLRAFREVGFRVTLVSGLGELLNRTSASEGVEWNTVPMRRPNALFADTVSLVRLWLLLRRLRPDLVEFSTPKAGLLGTVAARICGVPRRVYLLRGLKLETSTGINRWVLLAAEKMAARSAHLVLCNGASLRARALALGVAPA